MPSEEGLEPDPVEPNTPIDAFTTLGGVPQDGGEFSAPDITGGAITGSAISSRGDRGAVYIENGQIQANAQNTRGLDVSQWIGNGSISVEIGDLGFINPNSASVTLFARDKNEAEPDVATDLYAGVGLWATASGSGELRTGDNCIEIVSGASELAFLRLWCDGGIRIGNDHGFLHITPDGRIRVERDGQRINLI